MKKILKLSLIIFGLFISFEPSIFADENSLKEDIHDAIYNTIDGKLTYDINIKSIGGESDVDIRMSNADTPYLPSASTIKIFIGLAMRDAIYDGDFSYSDGIKEDLDLALRNSDNDATNRLIEKVGFDRINRTIFKYTLSDKTRLNRLMLGQGDENITNSKDLTKGLIEIYKSNDEISKDMIKSMEDSSSKRVKLLKDINPSLYCLNKTGELKNIENDLALINTGKSSFIISLLTEDRANLGRDMQIKLINNLGLEITEAFVNYDKNMTLLKEQKERAEISRMDTTEKKLAYAIYKNQISYDAASLLLKTNSVDNIRENLERSNKKSEYLVIRASDSLAKLTKNKIESKDDRTLNLIRLIYTDKEDIRQINTSLALAFYNNNRSLEAAKTLLEKSPRASLDIRSKLLANIKNSEEMVEKAKKIL